ncbi:hypothetical protein O181_017703 [Austropuccinia psidii MF-1]|uniref:Uncharacterized protein n=1 Tax=Austropuccinia psidii MF-1 TaxID=1389203 RepID=A0A9Q3C7L8_9BASI|nr:hypothetical protein [Austropuccinia psidii MF-1]
MENDFESAIWSSEKDKPFNWFLKQKNILSALNSDIYDSIININILRKFGGELEHAINLRYVEPCSTEDYINSMEDIITRIIIGKTWTKNPMEASNLANNCTKETKINGFKVNEEVQCAEEKEESDKYSAISYDTPSEDYPIENITAFFEVTDVHTSLPQSSEEFSNLINIQEARMCET